MTKPKPPPLSPKQQDQLVTYIEEHFAVKGRSQRGEIRVCCPECEDGDPLGHLYISKIYGLGYCFRCHFSPSYRDKVGASTVPDLSRFQKAIEILRAEGGKGREEDYSINWPEGMDFLPSGSVLGKRAEKYLRKRGFAFPEAAERFQLGVCNVGEMMGRLILPVFEKGKLVYYTGRTLIGQAKKYYNPEKVGQGKANFIFNLDVASRFKDGILVEGFFDSIRVGEKAMALLGSSLSEVQLEKLIIAGFERLLVCLDAEASKEALTIVGQLLPYFEIFRLQLPSGHDPDTYFREHKLVHPFRPELRVTGLQAELGLG